MNECFKDNRKVELVYLTCMLVEVHRTGSCGILLKVMGGGEGRW